MISKSQKNWSLLSFVFLSLMIGASFIYSPFQYVSAVDVSNIVPTTRDPLKWPFASNSIWNMPIGTGAIYVPADLPANPNNEAWAPMPNLDREIIMLRSNTPLVPVYTSTAAWTGRDRCTSTGPWIMSVHMPLDYIVPNSKKNNGAVFLDADGQNLVQLQPFTRCSVGGIATALLRFPSLSLYGAGVAGAHGGSGLSTLGGTIRVGELRPGSVGMRHVLKLNVHSNLVLSKCADRSQCYRWPATTADLNAPSVYGTLSKKINSAMKMGALLAIPRSIKLSSLNLQSEPGRQIAWTLQNYGAYIVDSTGGPGYSLSVEEGADGSVAKQFMTDYKYPMEDWAIHACTNPWVGDFQKIIQVLQVVDNNGPTSIGGGGTPLQPLAPEIHP